MTKLFELHNMHSGVRAGVFTEIERAAQYAHNLSRYPLRWEFDQEVEDAQRAGHWRITPIDANPTALINEPSAVDVITFVKTLPVAKGSDEALSVKYAAIRDAESREWTITGMRGSKPWSEVVAFMRMSETDNGAAVIKSLATLVEGADL